MTRNKTIDEFYRQIQLTIQPISFKESSYSDSEKWQKWHIMSENAIHATREAMKWMICKNDRPGDDGTLQSV